MGVYAIELKSRIEKIFSDSHKQSKTPPPTPLENAMSTIWQLVTIINQYGTRDADTDEYYINYNIELENHHIIGAGVRTYKEGGSMRSITIAKWYEDLCYHTSSFNVIENEKGEFKVNILSPQTDTEDSQSFVHLLPLVPDLECECDEDYIKFYATLEQNIIEVIW